MQNLRKQGKESGKVQLGLLVAVAVAAGAAGVWSELQAAGANTSRTVGGGVFAGGNGFGEISENGDGTGFTVCGTPLDNGWLSGWNMANTEYSVSADIKPGQSGKGTASGAGSATIDGSIIDFSTWEYTPVVIQLDIAVAGITEVSASVSQGVQVSLDPFTGDSVVRRVNRNGNDAYGYDAGAISFTVDGVPVSEETGVFGAVFAYSVNSVVRIK